MNEIMKAEAQPVTDADLTMHLENLGLLQKLSAGEKNTFLQIAKAFNLNPFKREIHVSKYGDRMSVITGYEVYIKRAERSGQLDGWSVVTEGQVSDNSLKAIITIHRKDRKNHFIWEVYYSEYVQKTNGAPNAFWQKAHTMIKKVAMSQGFRLCFSDELGGMPYTADEVGATEDAEVVSVTVHDAAKIPPAKKKVTEKGFEALLAKLAAPGADIDQIVRDSMEKLDLTDAQSELFVSKVAELQNTNLPV